MDVSLLFFIMTLGFISGVFGSLIIHLIVFFMKK